MKKLICFFCIMSIGCGLYAFDRSLNGSWGLIDFSGTNEIIWFNTDEIRVFDQLFESYEYEDTEDTIYIDDYEGDSIMIQYYRLSPNKLLFIMTNLYDSTESITMILSKL